MSDRHNEEPNWDAIARMDPTVRMMQTAGVPLTRENYIGLRYGEPGGADYPEQWTEEHEMGLPAPFQQA